MPIVHVHMLKGRSTAVKTRLASGITRVLVECTGVNAEAVRVLIQEVEAEHWFVGGTPKSPPAPAHSTFDDASDSLRQRRVDYPQPSVSSRTSSTGDGEVEP